MSNSTKGISYIIGVVMLVAMVGSTVLPLLRNNTNQAVAPEQEPTEVPVPTLPPPVDTSLINFDDTYLHSSGLFTVGVPTGWIPTVEDSTADEVRVSLGNGNALSVIEARIINPPEEVTDSDSLSAYFSDTWLGQTWRDYQSWEETSRAVNDDGHIVIDFNISRGTVNYVARQDSWIQDGDIYSVRVVTPENATDELKFLLSGMMNNVQLVKDYEGEPFNWNAYFDNTDKHMIRYPDTWTVTDAADGLPATITGDNITMQVETVDVALASEDEATNWLESWRSGVSALTVEPIEVDGASGYEVSYKLTTLDGAPESGLALMLNGSDNRLHVANARISNTDVDLQTAPAEDYPIASVLDTFRLFPDLNVTSKIGQSPAAISG